MQEAFLDSKEGARTFEELLRRIGLPTTGQASKVTRDDFTRAVHAYCGQRRFS